MTCLPPSTKTLVIWYGHRSEVDVHKNWRYARELKIWSLPLAPTLSSHEKAETALLYKCEHQVIIWYEKTSTFTIHIHTRHNHHNVIIWDLLSCTIAAAVQIFLHCIVRLLIYLRLFFIIRALFYCDGSFWLLLLFFISMALLDNYGSFWPLWLFLIVWLFWIIMALFDCYGSLLRLWLFLIVMAFFYR